MRANRVLIALLSVIAIPMLPVQLLTTLVLGVLVSLTFGILLLPISLIWLMLLGPLLGLSWLGSKVPVLREAIGFVFLPWAILADVFVCLMPSMGEFGSRALKMLYCETWPFTWAFGRMVSGKLDSESPEACMLRGAVDLASRGDPLKEQLVRRLVFGERIDDLV